MAPTTLVITLVIEGNEDDTLQGVDDLLDAGLLQDAINDHDSDAGPLRVLTALCRLGDRPSPPEEL